MNEVISPEEQREEDAYTLDKSTVQAALDAVERGDRKAVDALLQPMHPADIADLLEQIGEDDRRRLVRLIGRRFDGDVLSESDEAIRDEIIEEMDPQALAGAVRELESDDVVDIIEDLDEPQKEAVLDALDDAERVAVERAMSYPEYSAGRLMQRELVAVPEHWTVGQAIDHLRRAEHLPEQFYHLFLVNPKMEPVGYVTLGRLLSSRRDVPLKAITEDSFRTFNVNEDEADVAYAFNHYHLISAPVVDQDGRLVGMITIDDAMTVLDEEVEEDMLRLAGAGDSSSVADNALETTRQRFPWLAVNLLTAILASAVIGLFESTIAQYVALAVLMPIVASMGGNAGTQALTVAVRALATRDLTGSNVWRVIRREVLVGLANGLLFAVIMGLVGALWFHAPMLGVVIALAMIINMVVAGLAGVGIPVLLEKVGVDPALASGAFVTTVTDVVGFFSFLWLAGLLLL